MGGAVILDVLGSMLIGGLILLTLLRFNENTVQNSYAFNGEVIVQENLVAVIESLEYDLRKIGYCEDPFMLTHPSRAILFADTSQIKYLTDVSFSGNIDTVYYYLGSTDELSETPNPNDRMLYRAVNGDAGSVNLGVTQFYIKYYDALGQQLNTPLNVPTGITSMQIDIKIENTSAYDSDYKYAYWRQIRLASRNLSER